MYCAITMWRSKGQKETLFLSDYDMLMSAMMTVMASLTPLYERNGSSQLHCGACQNVIHHADIVYTY